MMSDFRGDVGSSKIGQNRTRGVGILVKIGHPIFIFCRSFVLSISLYNLISDCVPPFNVQIYTDSTKGIAAILTQRGVCLEYEQRPCS